MCRTLEGHVLENMRQTLLVVVFIERTGANAKADRCLSGRRDIAHDRKPHTVGERAKMYIGLGLMSLCVCGQDTDGPSA